MIEFEWDLEKNRANISKHGVSFEEAKSVFYDDNARLISDPDHSVKEERFVLLGLSLKLNLLTVVHCYRKANNKIRIISARKATRHEIKTYEEFLK